MNTTARSSHRCTSFSQWRLAGWLARSRRTHSLALRCPAEVLPQRRHHRCAAKAQARDSIQVGAHADDRGVGLGPWLPARNFTGATDVGLSPWFALAALNRKNAPWAFVCDGQPFRAIASFGSLRGALGGSPLASNSRRSLQARRAAHEAPYRQQRERPVSSVVMELAAVMRTRGLSLDVVWSPRETSEEHTSFQT